MATSAAVTATQAACYSLRYPDAKALGTTLEVGEHFRQFGRHLHRSLTCSGLTRHQVSTELFRRRLHEEGLHRLASPGKDCPVNSRPQPTLTPPSCSKVLWLAGLNAYGSCSKALAPAYAAALASAQEHASFLRPVLVLLQNESRRTRLQRWAEARGVHVLREEQLSFHSALGARRGLHPNTCLSGTFLRLDVARILKKYPALLDDPAVCGSDAGSARKVYALFTDVEVLFPRHLTLTDMSADFPREGTPRCVQKKKSWVRQRTPLAAEVVPTRARTLSLRAGSFVAYGVETKRDAIPLNVGVLLMDVHGFARELSALRAFGEVGCTAVVLIL